MAQARVRITLTPDQRGLIRQATGKTIAELGIEPVDTGSGLLYAAGGNKLWLLKDADPEGYRAARRRHQPHIDLRAPSFISESAGRAFPYRGILSGYELLSGDGGP
jgi:hypothetical protein